MSVGYRWRFIFYYTQLTPFGTDCDTLPTRAAGGRGKTVLAGCSGDEFAAGRINAVVLLRFETAWGNVQKPDIGRVCPCKAERCFFRWIGGSRTWTGGLGQVHMQDAPRCRIEDDYRAQCFAAFSSVGLPRHSRNTFAWA